MAAGVSFQQRTERALRGQVEKVGMPIQPEACMVDIALGVIALGLLGIVALAAVIWFARFR